MTTHNTMREALEAEFLKFLKELHDAQAERATAHNYFLVARNLWRERSKTLDLNVLTASSFVDQNTATLSDNQLAQPEQAGQAVAPEVTAEQYLQILIDRSPEPLLRLGKWLGENLDEDQWKTVERMLFGVEEAFSKHTTQPAAVQWQSIDTSPEDGEIIVFNRNGHQTIESALFIGNMKEAAKADGDECFYTHWMPLPAAPESQA